MPRAITPMGLALSVLFAGAALACGRQAQPTEPAMLPTHVYVFIDQSASVSGKQGDQWSKAVTEAASRLKSGDAITVFGLHDHTADAAALFAAATELPPPGAGVTRRTQDARALATMKEGATAAVKAGLFNPRRASWTDIFSAVDRIDPDPAGRRALVLLLTDALHSMPDLDLERLRLGPDTFRSVIEPVAKAHAWTSESLRNVDVAFVLNGLEMGEKRAGVDRRTLRAFYNALVQTLGAGSSASTPNSRGGNSYDVPESPS